MKLTSLKISVVLVVGLTSCKFSKSLLSSEHDGGKASDYEYATTVALDTVSQETITVKMVGFSGKSFDMTLNKNAWNLVGEHIDAETGVEVKTRWKIEKPTEIAEAKREVIKTAMQKTELKTMTEKSCKKLNDKILGINYDGDFPGITVGDVTYSGTDPLRTCTIYAGPFVDTLLTSFKELAGEPKCIKWGETDYVEVPCTEATKG